MNKNQVAKWKGRKFRLRPIAIRLSETGERLPQEDDIWSVSEVADDAVTINNLRTGHQWDLGLDNVREFRTPDFLLLRCQISLQARRVISEPLIFTSAEKNLSGFETLLRHSWVKEIIGAREVWISEVDNMFQIELGQKVDEFHEEWTRKFANSKVSNAYSVLLKIQGVEIKELTFISCDGGRVFVPIPKVHFIRKNERRFEYDRNSLEYRIARIIGQFHIFESLDGLAEYCGIQIK